MNRWLYRAAGTVGIAGGVLVFGAGSAHADQTDGLGSPIDDVFSPTSGLPPLELVSPDREPVDTSGLTLDPTDGRTAPAGGQPPVTGTPELLPGLPSVPGLPTGALGLPTDGLGLPTDGLGSLLGGVPLADSLPAAGPLADSLPLTGGSSGGGALAGGPGIAPAIGVLPPLDQLVQVDGQLASLNTDPGLATPLGVGAPAVPAPAPAGEPEIVGPMPFLTGPLTNSLLGGQSLGSLATLGALANQVPVAGPMVTSTVGNLPVVSDLVPRQGPTQPQPTPGSHGGTPGVHGGTPAGDAGARTLPADLSDPGLPLPAGGERLPAVIADQLTSAGGYAPELFAPDPAAARAEITGAIPLLGPALEPLGKMVGVGNLPSQLPLVGPLAGSTLGGLPVIGPAAGGVPGAPTGPGLPALPDPAALGGDRPVAGGDPEFAPPGRPAESAAPAQSTGSAEVLPIGPVRGLTQQLPVPQLPVPLPLETLRTLPLVGELASGLPL